MTAVYPYDARTPFIKGSVSACPGPKIHGLSTGQIKAMRKTNPTTPHHLRGGPLSLGMVSTVRASYSQHTPIPTRPVYQNRTPGRKRSIGTQCRGPSNRVFQAPIVASSTLVKRQINQFFLALTKLYISIQRDSSLSEQPYESKRDHFLRLYGHTHGKRLDAMEQRVNRAVKRMAHIKALGKTA